MTWTYGSTSGTSDVCPTHPGTTRPGVVGGVGIFPSHTTRKFLGRKSLEIRQVLYKTIRGVNLGPFRRQERRLTYFFGSRDARTLIGQDLWTLLQRLSHAQWDRLCFLYRQRRAIRYIDHMFRNVKGKRRRPRPRKRPGKPRRAAKSRASSGPVRQNTDSADQQDVCPVTQGVRPATLRPSLVVDTNVPPVNEKVIELSDQFDHFEYFQRRYKEWFSIPTDHLPESEVCALISKAVGRYRSYLSSTRVNHRPSDDDFYHSWQPPNTLWDIPALRRDAGLSLETVPQFVDKLEADLKLIFDEDHRITHHTPWGRYNSNVTLKVSKKTARRPSF